MQNHSTATEYLFINAGFVIKVKQSELHLRGSHFCPLSFANGGKYRKRKEGHAKRTPTFCLLYPIRAENQSAEELSKLFLFSNSPSCLHFSHSSLPDSVCCK